MMELTPHEIARNVHAHPTLSEALMEAAHGASVRRYIFRGLILQRKVVGLYPAVLHCFNFPNKYWKRYEYELEKII